MAKIYKEGGDVNDKKAIAKKKKELREMAGM
jgi:hypothetical protein